MTAKEAFERGYAAYADGMGAPISDPAIRAALEGVPVGQPQTKKLLRAWSRGYDKAAEDFLREAGII